MFLSMRTFRPTATHCRVYKMRLDVTLLRTVVFVNRRYVSIGDRISESVKNSDDSTRCASSVTFAYRDKHDGLAAPLRGAYAAYDLVYLVFGKKLFYLIVPFSCCIFAARA